MSPRWARMVRRLVRGFLWGLIATCVAGRAAAQTFSINPARSFLRASGETPPAAQAFVLADLGFQPGDGMRLEQLGDFKAGGPFQDTSQGMIAIFSGSNVLLGPGELLRVRDAVDAGEDVNTPNTYYGALTTDIPEDFTVDAVTVVQVPTGATHLFVAARDSLYTDNTDPDRDFAVRFSHSPIPGQAASALRIWAGLQLSTPAAVAELDVEAGASDPGISIRDACRLTRRMASLDP